MRTGLFPYPLISILMLSGVFGANNVSNQCCEPGTVLQKHFICSNGKPSTVSCNTAAILAPPESNYTVENTVLISGESSFYLGSYCLTKFNENDTELAIVCINHTFLESDVSWTIRAVCALLSSICLILTILVYALVPNLRDLQGKCILNTIVGLALAFFFLSAIQFDFMGEALCAPVAFANYLFFNVAFFWLNILSFDKWRTVVKPNCIRNFSNPYRKYCIYGYGMPLILLSVTLITNHISGDHIKPGFGEKTCWFSDNTSTWAYFYGPLTVLLILNGFFFASTAKVLWAEYSEGNSKCKNLKYRFFLYLKLFIIMGLNWIFEILSFTFDESQNFLAYIWLIVDYTNALQGALIFIILVLLRKKALRGLAIKEFWCLKFPKKWMTLQDEECEENDEVQTSLSQENQTTA